MTVSLCHSDFRSFPANFFCATQTEVVLRVGVLLLSRLFEQKSRFLLGHGESALTIVVHATEVVSKIDIGTIRYTQVEEAESSESIAFFSFS